MKAKKIGSSYNSKDDIELRVTIEKKVIDARNEDDNKSSVSRSSKKSIIEKQLFWESFDKNRQRNKVPARSEEKQKLMEMKTISTSLTDSATLVKKLTFLRTENKEKEE